MTTLAPLQQLQWLAISVLLAGSVFWGLLQWLLKALGVDLVHDSIVQVS